MLVKLAATGVGAATGGAAGEGIEETGAGAAPPCTERLPARDMSVPSTR